MDKKKLENFYEKKASNVVEQKNIRKLKKIENWCQIGVILFSTFNFLGPLNLIFRPINEIYFLKMKIER